MTKKNLIIKPQELKTAISIDNKDFKGTKQQCAFEFLLYFLDALHEEINLNKKDKSTVPNNFVNEKSKKFFFEELFFKSLKTDNSDNFSIDYQKLINSSKWCDGLIQDASFFHALFNLQLRSKFTCNLCKFEKYEFERSNHISIPIPSFIEINILLFRLPFTFKVYYEDLYEFTEIKNNQQESGFKEEIINNKSNFNINNLDKPINKIRTKLKLLKRKFIDNKNLSFEKISNEISMNSCDLTNELYNSNLNFEKFNNDVFNNLIDDLKSDRKQSYYDDINCVIKSKICTSIPVKIKLKLNKKHLVKNIINKLKNFKDLELEKNEEKAFTKLVIIMEKNIIDLNMKIGDTFKNGQLIYIYEFINFEGLNKLYKHDFKINCSNETENKSPIPFEKTLKSVLKNFNFNPLNNEDKHFEFLVKIINRIPINNNPFFFHPIKYINLEYFPDFSLFFNLIPIKITHIYNLIWEKYEYFIKYPNNFNSNLWWKIKNKEKVKNRIVCKPFVLKIVDRENYNCVKCPWFRFCTGCILNPEEGNFIIKYNHSIIVDWCLNVFENEFLKNHLNLVINYKIQENNVKESLIDDCSQKIFDLDKKRINNDVN